MSDISSILQKIKALADGTDFEHERASALEYLQRLMDKHGLTEADLDNLAVTAHEFKYKGERERKLLYQIIYKVIGHPQFSTYSFSRKGRKVANLMGIDCSNGQKLEIDFLFDFYKNLYHREEAAFYDAFIQKHMIFGKSTENGGKRLTKEESQKMVQMMNGMDDATPLKQIEAKE